MRQTVEVYGSGAFKAAGDTYEAQWSVNWRRGLYSFHIFTFYGRSARRQALTLARNLRRALKESR